MTRKNDVSSSDVPGAGGSTLKRGRLLGLGLGVVAVAAVVLVVRPRIESALGRRLVAEASARGLALELNAVHVGLWPPVLVEGLSVRRGSVDLRVPQLRVFVRPLGTGLVGRLSFEVPDGVEVRAPHGLVFRVGPTAWRLERQTARLALRRTGNGAGFALSREGDVVRLEMGNDAVGQWMKLTLEGRPLVDSGPVFGYVEVRSSGGDVAVDADVEVRDARVVALESVDGASTPHAWGSPVSLQFRLDAKWSAGDRHLVVRRARVRSEAAEAEAEVDVRDLAREALPSGRVSLDITRIELDRLFASLGIAMPVRTFGLGSLRIKLVAEGSAASPADVAVEPVVVYTSPARLPAAILALRGPFDHTARSRDGTERVVRVSPESGDFVSAAAVPAILKRSVVLAEDSGFWGHAGVDLGEIPKALAADWARGSAVRGASTITQQLAKNLFLSRDKTVSRKLKEVALAFLIERTIPKERILEIYLNVIEWGPGVYGLRPASRYYFGKEPEDLTVAESAFLVAIIPGPIKYQSSIAKGEMSEGFRPLVVNLLDKLLAVGAIDEGEHAAALAVRLRFKHVPLPPEVEEADGAAEAGDGTPEREPDPAAGSE